MHELMDVMWDLKVLVEQNDTLVEIITPIYLDWTVKEVMDRLKKKVNGATTEYGLYMESSTEYSRNNNIFRENMDVGEGKVYKLS